MPAGAYGLRETPLRRAVAVAAAAAAGCAYAAVLLLGLGSTYHLSSPPPPRVRFASSSFTKLTPQTAPEAPAFEGRLPVDLAPSEVEQPSRTEPRRKKPQTSPPAEALQEAPQPVDPVPVEVPAPTTEQMPTAAKPPSASGPAPDKPPVPEEDIYAPLRGRTYPEKPGGPVLVLAVLLDEHGNVLTTKIMVPSANVLEDMTYLLSLPGANLGPPEPPIQPGETRWVELRFRYENSTVELP
mgnify:CR=1 FL=1